MCRLLLLVICFWTLFQSQVKAYYDVLDPLHAGLEEWHSRDTRVAIRNEDDRQYLNCERPNLYICEEPPGVISSEATKTCNYRNFRYHEQIYRWVAGRGCLFYTPEWLYVTGHNNLNLTAACIYGGMFAPCLEIAKDDGTCGCFPFDPGFEEVANAVRDAIVPAAHGRWEKCYYSAVDCCSHSMTENYNVSENVCETTFDGWTCWHDSQSGTTASEVCSEFAYTNSQPSCYHYSYKECYQNGTWELYTDYSTCSISPRLLRRYRFHIAMLSFSIISCLPAIVIFFIYKRLRITRVALHRNLLLAIVVRNVLVIVSRTEVYIDELTNAGDTVMSLHGLSCRALAIAERIAANAVFVAMLVEGVYLHRLIVAVFKEKLNIKWLYGIGAVIAIGPVIIWSVIMGLYNNHSCWLVYTVDHVQWILDAPRITIILVNTCLFVDILRVLLTKIRNSENAHQLNTAKATLFLMPIFGTQFLLTALRPSTTECTIEEIYYYVSYAIEGLQGFIVAMIYCYVNKEVHSLIKATYKKTENAVVSRIRRDSNYQNASSNRSERRITASTGLESNKENSANGKPKLHVAEIVSIQASEKLAEILDPVYETIHHSNNECYDFLERSDNDSGFIPNRDSREEYYAFTNASSVSIDCQDWIRCISSPSSSVYNNSLNEYETRYLERKFANHPRLKEIIVNREKKLLNRDKGPAVINEITKQNENLQTINDDTETSDSIEGSEMLDEIMQYIGSNDNNSIILHPELLCPNRNIEDRVSLSKK